MKSNFSNVSTFMGMDNTYDESNLIVFGAGFDGTTSNRPGARFASTSMRNESYGLETYSPFLDLDLEDYNICDFGDLEISTGNTERVLKEIYDATKTIVEDFKIPLMIGGEHLITLPSFEAIYDKYKDIYIIHFDAHTDLRDRYNNNKNSHATVIRRIWDILGDGRIFQFGIRSGTKEEFRFSLEEKHTCMEVGNIKTFKSVVDLLDNKNVYLTIDLDVLDASIFPGTGTPEPGGINYREFQEIFKIIKDSKINIVGCDIVELSPDYDNSNVSTIIACKVLRELALVVADKSI